MGSGKMVIIGLKRFLYSLILKCFSWASSHNLPDYSKPYYSYSQFLYYVSGPTLDSCASREAEVCLEKNKLPWWMQGDRSVSGEAQVIMDIFSLLLGRGGTPQNFLLQAALQLREAEGNPRIISFALWPESRVSPLRPNCLGKGHHGALGGKSHWAIS